MQQGTGPALSRAGHWGSVTELAPSAACPEGACTLVGTAVAAGWAEMVTSRRTGGGWGTSARAHQTVNPQCMANESVITGSA